MLLPNPSYDSLALAALGVCEVLLAFLVAGLRARIEEPAEPRTKHEAPRPAETSSRPGVLAER